MKKTVTVNLDKTIFNIDDAAYTILKKKKAGKKS